MRVITPKYKIDLINNRLFEFGLFERASFLGIGYWKLISRSNRVRSLEMTLEEVKVLPRYFTQQGQKI